MTPEEAREIDRLEFEADCRAARERAYALVAQRRCARPVSLLKTTPPKSDDKVTIRRSNARLYSMDGKSLPLVEWSAMCGHSVPVLRWRMHHGMSFEQAVTTPKLKRCVKWEEQIQPSAPGVVKNLPDLEGTGGGSTAQDIPQLEFLQ